MSTSRRSSRDLNRATLARQRLLERSGTPLEVIEALAGLQSQIPRPPFIGLWSRVPGFTRAALHQLVHDRQVVRATMMRGTIHLMSSRDYLALRGAMSPLLSAGVRRMRGSAAATAHARRQLPATFAEVREALAKRFPRHPDHRALSYALRLHLPLVIVPNDARWSYAGNAAFHDAAVWLGSTVAASSAADLVLRYLAAFGPATIKDAQAWSGLRKLGPVFASLRDRLVVDGHYFDLPDAPRPADARAPVRFLPEYDNLMMAYADPSRIVTPAQRATLVSKNGIISATFLVDGEVGGTWTIEREGARATLRLAPFAAIPKPVRAELEAEGEALLRWHEPDATKLVLRVGRP